MLADLSGDGDLDAACVSTQFTSISKEVVVLFLGDGAGGLGRKNLLVADAQPSALAAGDLDQAGGTDLAVAGATRVAVLLSR